MGRLIEQQHIHHDLRGIISTDLLFLGDRVFNETLSVVTSTTAPDAVGVEGLTKEEVVVVVVV